MQEKLKEFFATSWSIDNKVSIYILTAIICLAGFSAYNSIPKEQFPEVVIPTIYISTIYPGASPSDIENTVTKPIEKKLKSVSGIKKLTSNSLQDFSTVIVEFDTEFDVATAKEKVKDAVDKAKPDLPKDLLQQPNVIEVDLSEIPIMNINLSGDFDLTKLKRYADNLKDGIEEFSEITRVDVVGGLEREIQIDVDMYKMQAAQIALSDVENAIAYENITISGGTITMDGMKRSIRAIGEFKTIDELQNVIINSAVGNPIFLKDIATITDGYKEKESYARLAGKNVVTLNVIKRGGGNLIAASDKIRDLITQKQKSETVPKTLDITITGDQSEQTRTSLNDLINTIIIGFVLVTLVLMFFMGGTNALFVALSIPISSLLAFILLPTIDFTLNTMVLFAFILALGIVVDDAIVVIENTHRIYTETKMPIIKAAKLAAGQVFVPVLSGTLTTIAPFIPLAFWGGIIGKFIFYLPITLIIALLSSLFVAYIINPVFAVDFMEDENNPNDSRVKRNLLALPPVLFLVGILDKIGLNKKNNPNNGLILSSVILGLVAIATYIFGNFGLGNFWIFVIAALWFYNLILVKAIHRFQFTTWPKAQRWYGRFLERCLEGKNPIVVIGSTVLLLIISLIAPAIFGLKVEFFPTGDPNIIFVYNVLPAGTSQEATDSVTKIIESRVYEAIGTNNPLVESVISNVAVNATDPQDGDRSVSPHKSRVQIAFVPFEKRNGEATKPLIDAIRQKVKGIAGATITVDQEQSGPPTGKPISIEIAGDDFKILTTTSQNLKRYLDSLQIGGVEELKSDLVVNNPELLIRIDRERMRREGIATGQIGSELRTAIFGKEISKFRDANDEYPIVLRYLPSQRQNIDAVMNAKITFRDMAKMGLVRQIPISSVATTEYSTTYSGIKRKNQKRIVTLGSNVLSDYNPNEVVANIQDAVASFKAPEGCTISMGGEQEEQKESMAFLSNALLISIGLILIILVIQFNSLSKPLIIISEILFSIIGVLLGFSIFGMNISIVMTGIGIVALAGIVVKNAILIIEYTDVLLESGGRTFKQAIAEAGRIRMTPVILTAGSAVLGLIPLAIGLNIDFFKLFSEFNPHIFFGGDNVVFFGPLSYTIIFGLTFSTFLTLIVVPVMYYLSLRQGEKSRAKIEKLA